MYVYKTEKCLKDIVLHHGSMSLLENYPFNYFFQEREDFISACTNLLLNNPQWSIIFTFQCLGKLNIELERKIYQLQHIWRYTIEKMESLLAKYQVSVATSVCMVEEVTSLLRRGERRLDICSTCELWWRTLMVSPPPFL